MTTLITSLLAATAAAFALGSSVQAATLEPNASCTTAPQGQWQSLASLRTFVLERGHVFAQAKMSGDSCVEINAMDARGRFVRYVVDPVSGNPVISTLDENQPYVLGLANGTDHDDVREGDDDDGRASSDDRKDDDE